MTIKTVYPRALADEEWQKISQLFQGMCNRKWDKRVLVNVIFYLDKTVCQCRQLSNDFPPYTTVSSFYHRAYKSGLWDKILQHVVKRGSGSK